MTSNFWIQASNPSSVDVTSEDASTLEEAIESIFPRETEDAILVWSNVYIPLSYKYDLSTIVVDVLNMLQQLLASEDGEWSVEWPSNTFAMRWQLTWKGEQLSIRISNLRSVVGDTEALLIQRPELVLNRAEFLREWKSVLDTITLSLKSAGYTVTQIPELVRLASVAATIHGKGRLYRALMP